MFSFRTSGLTNGLVCIIIGIDRKTKTKEGGRIARDSYF